jgi:acyl-CoA dehydrogenase
MNAYRVSLREMRFFLWELFDVESRFMNSAPYCGRSREQYDELLERARDFAFDIGKSYRASDIEGCNLREDGEVQIPADFHPLWERFRSEWVATFNHKKVAQEDSANTENTARANVPPIITQVIMEMFMGANPSFMTYGGFTRPAMKLLELHGTPTQKAFIPQLAEFSWDACFCATERLAGSDLTAVTTRATQLDGELYEIKGEKIYISAGMHSLTENTLYFVLSRVESAKPDSFSLSCMVVPRFWPNPETGELEPNHVECIDLPRKMGLKGCANTHLVFGRNGTTRALLLGNRKNVGLLQLMPLMNQARMSTGMFGVGVSSSAYLHAVDYANSRYQGRVIDGASDSAAPRVKIIEHADVQRMLLEMKCRVDGCRGLLGKLAAAATKANILETTPNADPDLIERHRKLQLLLTPICKAYISDQAWRICEIAIQVHGGLGYTDQSPVEQNARDVKILSIWEGTNYIQAQDLVRDKLGFGRNSRIFRYFREELDDFLGTAPLLDENASTLIPLFDQLRECADALEHTLGRISEEVQGGRMRDSSQFYTRFLEMFGMVASGWVLLESASISQQRLAVAEVISNDAESAFYRGKVKSAFFFFSNILPLTQHYAATLARMGDAVCTVSGDELAMVE